ncbi:MAG: tRNA-dihydrouridine synthase family protein [Bacteroidales bacterium]|nr:tRNA-dihydrouridine synthase family protein [Bacteroidales bacterium]
MTVSNQAEPKLQLGPFQGITDVWYRIAFQKYFNGIDQFFTAFFSGIHTDNSKNLHTPEIDPNLNPMDKLIPQLLSNDADEVLRFAQQINAMGFTEMNLNMGCPYPLVARKKRGSGILPYPDIVKQLLEILSAYGKIRYSVKCRLGYEQHHEIDQLIPLFNQYGLNQLIIHARIGKQLYKGSPLTKEFGRIHKRIIPELAYNGDIFSVETYLKLSKKFPAVQSWMLGRGLLSDPFLAADIKKQAGTIHSVQRLQTVEKFLQEIYYLRRTHSRDNLNTLGRMKELWSYLRYSFDDEQQVWRLVKRVKTFEEYENAVSEVMKSNQWIGKGYQRKLDKEEQDKTQYP